MGLYLKQALFQFIFEMWNFFKSLFFNWSAIVLVTIILIIFLFKNQIRYLLNSFAKSEKLDSVSLIEGRTFKRSKSNWRLSNWIAVLISCGALFFSIYSYSQLLVRYEPKVAFMDPQLIREEDGTGRLSYGLKNLGEGEAKNVKIKFSVCTQFNCSKVPLFDDELSSTLYPGIPQVFGYSDFSIDDMRYINNEEKGAVLIYGEIEYDNLFKSKPSKEVFYYWYNAKSGLTAVLKKDLCAIKFNDFKEGQFKDFISNLDFCKSLSY